MRFPAEMRRLLEDDQVDRPGVHGGRPPQPTGPNSRVLDHPDPPAAPAAVRSGPIPKPGDDPRATRSDGSHSWSKATTPSSLLDSWRDRTTALGVRPGLTA